MSYTYSLAEIRNGTGWPKGVRFVEMSEEEAKRCELCDAPMYGLLPIHWHTPERHETEGTER